MPLQLITSFRIFSPPSARAGLETSGTGRDEGRAGTGGSGVTEGGDDGEAEEDDDDDGDVMFKMLVYSRGKKRSWSLQATQGLLALAGPS